MNFFIKSLVLTLAISFSSGAEAWAGVADRFVGWYRLDSVVRLDELGYMLLDNDKLGVLWDRYADTPLPEDLEKYREEMSIIAGFTHQDYLVLTFEALATVTDRYLRIVGEGNELFEIYQRDDGQYLVGYRQGPVTRVFVSGLKEPLDGLSRDRALTARMPLRPMRHAGH